MNRAARRRAAKEAGIPWADQRAEAEALKLSPARARELLALWAAQPGRTQAEIDALNGADHVQIR